MPIEELLGLRGNVFTVCTNALVGVMLVFIGVGVFVSMPQLPMRIGTSVSRLRLWPIFTSGTRASQDEASDSAIGADMMFTPVVQPVDALVVLQGFGLGALVLVAVALLNSCTRALILAAADTLLLLKRAGAAPLQLVAAIVRNGSVPVDIRLYLISSLPRKHVRGLLDYLPSTPGTVAAGRLIGLLTLRRVVLQVAAGLAADAMSLPLVPATLSGRVGWAMHHPLSFFVCHWLLGVLVLALTSTIVLQMRESLRYPLVARWTRQHSGNMSQMLREAMDRPLLQHLWGASVMLLLSSVFVAGLVLAPASLAAIAGSRMQLLPVSMPELGRDLWSANASRSLAFSPPMQVSDADRLSASVSPLSSGSAVDVSAVASSLISAARWGDVSRGAISVLSVQCLLAASSDTTSTDGLAGARIGGGADAGVLALPPTCPPGRVLALRLNIRCQHYPRRGIAVADAMLLEADESIRPFAVGGFMAAAPTPPPTYTPTPEPSALPIDTSDEHGDESVLVRGVRHVGTLVLFAFTTMQLVLSTLAEVFISLLELNLAFTLSVIDGTMQLLVTQASRLALTSTRPLSPLNSSSRSNSSAGHYIYEDDADAVFMRSAGEPSFNLTVLEGSHEFALLAPPVWRALALLALEDGLSSRRDTLSSETPLCRVGGGAFLPSAAIENRALSTLPNGLQRRNFVAVFTDRSKSKPTPTLVPKTSDSEQNAASMMQEPDIANGGDNVSSAVQESSIASGNLSVIGSSSEETLTYELLLRRMPVLRFYSHSLSNVSVDDLYLSAVDDAGISTGISAAQRNALRDSPPFALSWRLRYVGAVELKMEPLLNNSAAGISTLRSTVTNNSFVSITGSRFRESASLHLSYRLPPSVVPRVDDLTIWWASYGSAMSLLGVSVHVGFMLSGNERPSRFLLGTSIRRTPALVLSRRCLPFLL